MSRQQHNQAESSRPALQQQRSPGVPGKRTLTQGLAVPSQAKLGADGVMQQQEDQEPTAEGEGTDGAATQMPGPRENLNILPELDRMYVALLEQGYPTRIASGYRTIDDQIQLYAQGRTFEEFERDITAAVRAGTVTQAKADEWIAYYRSPEHPMPSNGPVTWTFASSHVTGDAADVVHATLGNAAGAEFWAALQAAAEAEGLQIGPPTWDRAHVQRPRSSGDEGNANGAARGTGPVPVP